MFFINENNYLKVTIILTAVCNIIPKDFIVMFNYIVLAIIIINYFLSLHRCRSYCLIKYFHFRFLLSRIGNLENFIYFTLYLYLKEYVQHLLDPGPLSWHPITPYIFCTNILKFISEFCFKYLRYSDAKFSFFLKELILIIRPRRTR